MLVGRPRLPRAPHPIRRLTRGVDEVCRLLEAGGSVHRARRCVIRRDQQRDARAALGGGEGAGGFDQVARDASTTESGIDDDLGDVRRVWLQRRRDQRAAERMLFGRSQGLE